MIHLHSTNPARAGFYCGEGDVRGRVAASRFASFFVALRLCVSKMFSHEDAKTQREEGLFAAGAAGWLA
jgi:hypothetical protein